MFRLFILRRFGDLYKTLAFRMKFNLNDALTVKFILNPYEIYNFEVDWGDGNTNIYTTSATFSHTYSNKEMYDLKIYGEFPDIYKITME